MILCLWLSKTISKKMTMQTISASMPSNSQICRVLLEEEGVHHSLQEGSEAEDEGHEHVGGGEAVEVGEEVAGVLAVLVVVAQVVTNGDQQNQHEEGGADLEDGGGEGVGEEDLEGSEAEEGEIFQVALDEQLDEDESEGVGP